MESPTSHPHTIVYLTNCSVMGPGVARSWLDRGLWGPLGWWGSPMQSVGNRNPQVLKVWIFLKSHSLFNWKLQKTLANWEMTLRPLFCWSCSQKVCRGKVEKFCCGSRGSENLKLRRRVTGVLYLGMCAVVRTGSTNRSGRNHWIIWLKLTCALTCVWCRGSDLR